MKKNVILIGVIGLIIIGLSVVLFTHCRTKSMFVSSSPHAQRMFQKWNDSGDINYEQHGCFNTICIVQYTPRSDDINYKKNYKKMNYEVIQRERAKMQKYVIEGNYPPLTGDYPLLEYVPVKVYSDKGIIKKILGKLNSPEQRQNYKVETEDYLLLIGISRKLNSQFILRIPFKLTEDGYAITRRGRDKELYEILNSGLKEWEEQKKAEKDRDDAVYRLYKQARESDKVDYNTLFIELKKLDALSGVKDPNELKLEIQKQKEGMRQMRGPEEPHQPHQRFGL
jgi:hypothetical protein